MDKKETIQKEKDDSVLSTLVAATKIVDYIGAKRKVVPSEMMKELGMTKGTLYRLLETLKSCNVVESDDDGAYLLTFKMFEIGNSVIYQDKLINCARPEMLKLAEDIQTTVQLGIMFENQVMCLDIVESENDLLLDQPVGSTEPLFSTAAGKVMLAYLNNEQREEYYKYLKTDSDFKDLDTKKIDMELNDVRIQGHAKINQEIYSELICVAAPIWKNNTVVAAINICSPADRFSEAAIRAVLPKLKKTASAISEKVTIPA